MPSVDPAIAAVLNADHLSEETRRVYSSKLGIIAQAMCRQSTPAEGVDPAP